MPPRRSCFAQRVLHIACSKHVSMPPRRSCFLPHLGTGWSRKQGFNATTAFLLLEIRWHPQRSRIRFNATTAFLLIAASSSVLMKTQVSMPPRRSCLR